MKTDSLGTPDVSAGGLRIWVFGREFPHATDYWDGNWLRVCVDVRSEVEAAQETGSILHADELAHWLRALRGYVSGQAGHAELNCVEPFLHAVVRRTTNGDELSLDINRDLTVRQASFVFALGSGAVDSLVGDLDRILAKYPVRAQRD